MKETTLALTLSSLSFLLAIIWGGPLLRVLRHFRIGKLIRVEEPDSHVTKMGTPTMGGVMFIIPVVFLTLLLNAATLIGVDILESSVLLPCITLVVFGILGAIDDWEGIRGPRRGLGMRIRTKFLVQTILALLIVLVLRYVLTVPQLHWPGARHDLDLGIWYIPIAMFIIVGASNAVNFTDGMDGLAGLISATSFVAYGVIALMHGQIFLGRFCFTLVGAVFGFLWFNVHPAQLFMGDSGALALGATLGVVALMTGQWLTLPLIAIIPVSEAVSDLLQIGYFRLTKGKRLFKMAPLHLHFELSGWSETQVVQRFWLVSLVCAMLGLALSMV
jgi:phospho-N-acetylmuramoyl-pentapeptide-transferase